MNAFSNVLMVLSAFFVTLAIAQALGAPRLQPIKRRVRWRRDR